MLLKLIMKLETVYLLRKGWTHSTMRGAEPVWVSPKGVKVVDTELGCVICMQYDAIYRQRSIDIGLTPRD